VKHDTKKNIILIDSIKLSTLMYDFNVGVQFVESYIVKEIDGDFFDRMEEDNSKNKK